MGTERLVVVLLMAVNGLAWWSMERRAHARERTADHVGPNLALTALLLVVNTVFDRVAAASGFGAPAQGLLAWWSPPAWASVLVTIVALDGTTYLAHVLMHKLAPAWRFHRVHHSDPHVDVTTAFRQHPFETVWRFGFLLAAAQALGASSRAVMVYLAWSALNAQLEHAHVTWPPWLDRTLRAVIATPAMHRVHHSRVPRETDSNYSNIFSLWDRVFGTYRPPRGGETIATGLDDCDAPARQRTPGLLTLPFRG
ncbi:MAG TPA: sterol desaturase family protein [Vicinamibacteria bacterium]|nr:sterol desaturase family protein [Vicinamibacteria bacterium]